MKPQKVLHLGLRTVLLCCHFLLWRTFYLPSDFALWVWVTGFSFCCLNSSFSHICQSFGFHFHINFSIWKVGHVLPCTDLLPSAKTDISVFLCLICVRHPGCMTLKITPADSWFNWLWKFSGKGEGQSEGLTAASVAKNSTYEVAEIQCNVMEVWMTEPTVHWPWEPDRFSYPGRYCWKQITNVRIGQFSTRGI